MEDLDFLPLKYMCFLYYIMFELQSHVFGSLVKNNKLRGFAVSFKAVESEIAEKMVKSYYSI